MNLQLNSPQFDSESTDQDLSKITPLSKVGSEIKQAREKQQIPISFLAESLKIGEEQLIALEGGDESLLPEKVFIKGMISRVAEKLNLDSEQLIKILSSSVSQMSHQSNKEGSGDSEKAKNKPNIVFLCLLSSSIFFILISTITLERANRQNKLETSENGLIQEIELKKEITISSIKPTKITIINGKGETLFNGIIEIPLKYQLDNGLELYTYRPDLIEIEADGMVNTVLGSKEDIRWHDLSLISNQ